MSKVGSLTIPRLSVTWMEAGSGHPIVLELVINDAAGDDYDIEADETIEVLDAHVIKSGAGTGTTVQIKNGSTAITDAMAATVDKAITRAAQIDPAQCTIVSGGTLRFTTTRSSGSAAMRVFVRALVKLPSAPTGTPTAP